MTEFNPLPKDGTGTAFGTVCRDVKAILGFTTLPSPNRSRRLPPPAARGSTANLSEIVPEIYRAKICSREDELPSMV
jgi:hypothetical protein